MLSPVRRIRIALSLLSVLLCAVLFVCYVWRPDRATAVTIIPPLLWAVPGIGLALLSLGRARLVTVLLWVAFLLTFGETASLVRGLRGPETGFDAARMQGKALRVITINAAGAAQSLEQVVQYEPDVVVVQEPPELEHVEEVARRLFGLEVAVVYGTDCLIVYRGRPPADARHPTTARARVELGTGEEIAVLGTHLASTRPSFHLWRRDRWHRLAEDRRRRRDEMREVVGVMDAVPAGMPIILAGDFNAPAGDAVFRLLRPRLRDAFAEAGRGWGNTWSSSLPLVRIDQVWISREWRAVDVRARRAGPSDHWMVVCDLERRE
ncbi:MAG: endonuclease/exonuclease/phosphatase family protein [Armatimonadetes bacterium]|nr:endonuclease/exonuclease/phosphatase family protein [Armatimonadota bacterium]